jgi:hypothetical protein
MLLMEYVGFCFIQVILKSLVYSVKLKLELGVLSRLVSLINLHSSEPTCCNTSFSRTPDGRECVNVVSTT